MNVATEASLQTRLKVWWQGVPLITRCTFALCVGIFAVSALIGFDDLGAVCMAAQPVIRGEVYRVLTSAVFHGGLLHLTFNMLALVPIGSSLERSLGSLQLCWLMLLIAILGGALYLTLAYTSLFLPAGSLPSFLAFGHQCAVGLSGVIFGLVVIDNHLSGAATRSIFGLFTVPARLYPWALVLVWQLLVPGASLLGHACGLLVGQAYVWGLLRWCLPSSAFYHAVERSAACNACMRSSGFIAHTGGSASDAVLPTARPSAGYQSIGSPTAREGSGWLRGPWMPFPPSSDRLASLLNPFGQQQQQQHAAAVQGGRLGGSQQPTMDPKAAAAAAAEARLARAAGGKPSGSGGGGSSSSV